MSESTNADPVFLWRAGGRLTASSNEFEKEAELYGLNQSGRRWHTPDRCPFCTQKYDMNYYGDEIHEAFYQTDNKCVVCGYYNRLVDELYYSATDMKMELGPNNLKDQHFIFPVLKRFDLNDTELTFEELGTWVRTHQDSIYDLDPRRFEELVTDVFKNMGYVARLTQASKDGGVDIYLLDKMGKQAIVQVKRYAKHRKIGVELIDQVRGVKLRPIHRDVTKAFVVTSSSFTRGAIELAAEGTILTDFEMELIDCERLMREMDTYNADIASLPDYIQRLLINRGKE